MRVLWTVNMMPKEFAQAMGGMGTDYQGWIAGLRDALRQERSEIELYIVCEGKNGQSATCNGVHYVAVDLSNPVHIRRVVTDINPDVIHIHGTEGAFAAFDRSCWCEKPVCLSLQGIMNGCGVHYLGALSESELSPYLTLFRRLHMGFSVGRVAKLWRTDFSNREKKCFRQHDFFLGRTDWDRAWTQYLNPHAGYATVGELLRKPFYSGVRSESEVIPRTIFCCGALAYPLKGGHWLLQAVAALKRQYPNVRLRVANADRVKRPRGFMSNLRWGQYERYLDTLIGQLGLEGSVDLLPPLSAEKVAEELRRAEVYCLPSLVENSPNSLGEALMLGVPAVAANVGGVSSIMRADEGLLVPSGDPAVLYQAISNVFDGRAAAQERARRAYERAVRTYSPSVVVGQLMHAYDRAIGKIAL